jgi:hypothetical protein
MNTKTGVFVYSKQHEKKQKRLTSQKWGIGDQWRGELRHSKSRESGVNCGCNQSHCGELTNEDMDNRYLSGFHQVSHCMTHITTWSLTYMSEQTSKRVELRGYMWGCVHITETQRIRTATKFAGPSTGHSERSDDWYRHTLSVDHLRENHGSPRRHGVTICRPPLPAVMLVFEFLRSPWWLRGRNSAILVRNEITSPMCTRSSFFCSTFVFAIQNLDHQQTRLFGRKFQTRCHMWQTVLFCDIVFFGHVTICDKIVVQKQCSRLSFLEKYIRLRQVLINSSDLSWL